MIPRWCVWAAALSLVVACGDDSSAPGGSGATGGVGGVGGVGGGGVGGDSGTGAVSGGGGSGALPPHDPALDCPAKPYSEPPGAALSGSAPALDWATAIGAEGPDGIDGIAPLPSGDFVALLWKKSDGADRLVVSRAGPSGTVAWSHEWASPTSERALIGSDAVGHVYVASVASEPFEVAGVSIGPATGSFAYLIELDDTGALVSHETFAYTGKLALRSIAVRASGEVVLAGSISKSVDLGGVVLEVPAFMSEILDAAFVVRLSADGDHVWSRVFPSSGVHNQPPALPGTGGTNGLGHSVATDVAWAGDDVVVSAAFWGALDLGTIELPNDDLTDAVVAKLDATGATLWARHAYSLLAESIPGNGGQAGFIPEGNVSPSRVAVSTQGRVAVTGPLTSRARLDSTLLDAGAGAGYFTAVFESNGSVVSAVADGGVDLAFDAAGSMIVWDGTALFGMQGATVAWSFAPGGTLLATKPGEFVDTQAGLLLAGTFFGRLDLGSQTIESAGCADGFVVRFAP